MQKVRKQKTKVENLTLSEKYQHNQGTNKTEIKALKHNNYQSQIKRKKKKKEIK